MVRSSFKIILTLLTIISGCNTNSSYYLTQANKMLNEQRKGFGKESSKDSLLSHFPTRIKNDSVSFHSSPPSCPPSFRCSKQFGEIYIIVDKLDYQEELSNLLAGKIGYKAAYVDINVIVNLSELRKDIFPVEKCNKWYAEKLPIPYFEDYDFGLGEKKEKKIIEGEETPYYNHIHTIPSDLQVYVVKAEAGDFWKESCNEARPESLKEWQHGYSKGFATSEKENMIVYWTMIW